MDVRTRDQLLRELGITQWICRQGTASSRSPAGQAVEVAARVSSDTNPQEVNRSRNENPLLNKGSISAAGAVESSLAQCDWDELRTMVDRCTACALSQTRNRAVFGVGPETAPLMVIGEGPGADEDIQGKPFVGRAGKLLDEMLKAIGYSRSENAYITNVVKCRPPGNRDPLAVEAEACRSYLDRQIALIKPRLIVGLGRVAAQRLLATDLPLSKLRGQLHQYGRYATPVLLTYHPAYLLRSPREKAKAWVDLKRMHRFLQSGE